MNNKVKIGVSILFCSMLLNAEGFEMEGFESLDGSTQIEPSNKGSNKEEIQKKKEIALKNKAKLKERKKEREKLAPKFPFYFEVMSILGMANEEFMSVMPDSNKGNIKVKTYYWERRGRLNDFIERVNRKLLSERVKEVDKALEEAARMEDKKSAIKEIERRIIIGVSEEVDKEIFIGRLYLAMALYYADGYVADKNLIKAKKYVEEGSKYLSGTAKVMNIFKDKEMKNGILAEGLSTGKTLERINKEFNDIFNEYRETGLKKESLKIEYVYVLNDYIIYLQATNQTKSVQNYESVLKELETQYRSLKRINQFGSIIDND